MKKKFCAVILLTVLLSGQALAQERYSNTTKNEISLSWGYLTGPQFAMGLAAVFGAAFTLGNWSLENSKVPGVFSVEYYRILNQRWAVGAVGAFDLWISDAYSGNGEDRAYSGKFNNQFYTLMPAAKYYYFNHPHCGLYSKLAAGVSVCVSPDKDSNNLKDISTQVTPAGYICPIGVDFGGQTFRGFVEAGIGWQGVLNFGVKKMF